MPDHRRLLPGVFVGSHAVSEGYLTRTQLRQRSYRRLVHGVYADPGLPHDHMLVARGVALLLPPGTAIGGMSAAAFLGAAVAAPRDPVAVVRPAAVEWKGPQGVRVHRGELGPRDVVVIDDVPVTDAARTAWDVAAWEPLGTAVATLDAMLRAQVIDVPTLVAQAAGGSGRWGVTKVRRAALLVDPRAASPPESRLRVALAMAGLHLEPQCPVSVDGWEAHVDLGDPEVRVAVEYEGEYHFVGSKIEQDDVRYARLEAAGWIVIRVSARDLHDLDGVVRRVQQAIGSRR